MGHSLVTEVWYTGRFYATGLEWESKPQIKGVFVYFLFIDLNVHPSGGWIAGIIEKMGLVWSAGIISAWHVRPSVWSIRVSILVAVCPSACLSMCWLISLYFYGSSVAVCYVALHYIDGNSPRPVNYKNKTKHDHPFPQVQEGQQIHQLWRFALDLYYCCILAIEETVAN